jgi:hypothetical protein
MIIGVYLRKARYELKVVLLPFERKCKEGFIYIPLADFFIDRTAPEELLQQVGPDILKYNK